MQSSVRIYCHQASQYGKVFKSCHRHRSIMFVKALRNKWYNHVRKDEVRQTTKQAHLSATVPSTAFLPVRPHCVNAR